ncbi:MAG: hypothetical protein LLF98_09055 [Clostridium sp.]|uniref:hypothetical protein n=1 Tax=Clostridium sp. TaxID=1506 RepID=UPI0025C09185|nr:hypothetical protein [Clostridium sp.]MCE5221390.1 hypothetical protein [Clostridium sp.]
MTYCLAWKKEKSVYMIADTAVSEKTNELESTTNSFGEVQGLYGKHYIQEGVLKIYKVSPNLAISYSGNVDAALEIIQRVYQCIYEMNISEIDTILKSIENSYDKYDVEMIFIFSKGQDDNHIYLFSEGSFSECDYAEIGSGKSIHFLSDDMKGIVNGLYSSKFEKEYYLSMIIACSQCYILKNDIFKYGVGGTLSGILLNNTLKWFRDIEYYLVDDDISQCKAISVIVRNNSVFSSSDIDGKKRYMLNSITDTKIWEDLYLRKGIIKSLDTKNAFYYVFYSRKYNVIYFMNVNSCVHNIHFRRYIRRGNEETDYAYTFRPDFKKHFIQFDSHNERIPALSEMQVIPTKYISHKEILEQCNEEDILQQAKHEDMDFDFSIGQYPGYDISLITPIKKVINEYHNLVLIDYQYFCDAVEEKINLYEPFRAFKMENLNLEAIVNNFMKQMIPDEFEKYLFCVVKQNNYKKVISGYNMDDFFDKYNNAFIINVSDLKNGFYGTLLAKQTMPKCAI